MLARLRAMSRARGGLVACAVLLAGAATASASWHMPGGGAGLAQASIDFHAPIVTGETIAPAGASAAGGAIAPGGQFVVYANVVDVGVSGIAWVRTNVSSVETGATLGVALAVQLRLHDRRRRRTGGRPRRRPQTPGSPRAAQSYGVWSQDNAGNLGTTLTRSVIVDWHEAHRYGRRGRHGVAGHRLGTSTPQAPTSCTPRRPTQAPPPAASRRSLRTSRRSLPARRRSRYRSAPRPARSAGSPTPTRARPSRPVRSPTAARASR